MGLNSVYCWMLAFAFLGFTGRVHAGTSGAGGGDAIQCDDGKLYAWDYVDAKFSNFQLDPEFLSAKSADEILAKIITRLGTLNLPMAASLNDFSKRNTNPLDETTKRLWIYTTNPLVNIGDEDRTQIPISCIAKATAQFPLYQAVIRQQLGRGDKVIYQADQKLLDRLAANSPIQLSFLFIHEWLRDYVSDSRKIVLVDQLLHSPSLYNLNPTIFRKTLESFGLNIPTDTLTPFIKVGKYRHVSGLIPWGDDVVQTVPCCRDVETDSGPNLFDNLAIQIRNSKLRLDGQFALPIRMYGMGLDNWVYLFSLRKIEAVDNDDLTNGLSVGSRLRGYSRDYDRGSHNKKNVSVPYSFSLIVLKGKPGCLTIYIYGRRPKYKQQKAEYGYTDIFSKPTGYCLAK